MDIDFSKLNEMSPKQTVIWGGAIGLIAFLLAFLLTPLGFGPSLLVAVVPFSLVVIHGMQDADPD